MGYDSLNKCILLHYNYYRYDVITWTPSLAGSNDLNELLQFIRILQTHHSRYLLAILHAYEYGYGADIEIKGQVVVLIDVHLEGVKVRCLLGKVRDDLHDKKTHLGQSDSRNLAHDFLDTRS